jgi:hypothetical protein
MKKHFLILSLVGFALTAAGANAAPAPVNSEPIQMPVYRVVAERQTPVERSIERSLDQLRDAAKKPLSIRTELPSLSDNPTAKRLAAKQPLIQLAARF